MSVESITNARNVSFRISLRWPVHIINLVDKTKLSSNKLIADVGIIPAGGKNKNHNKVATVKSSKHNSEQCLKKKQFHVDVSECTTL